jgi:hypothetical protein
MNTEVRVLKSPRRGTSVLLRGRKYGEPEAHEETRLYLGGCIGSLAIFGRLKSANMET